MSALDHSNGPDPREQNEIERSAARAAQIVLSPVNLDRYLNPSSDTTHPLEYAYYLLGDVRGKTVLDFGCGSGENLVALVRRGAQVVGIDISPELIDLAKQRVQQAQAVADLRVASAYKTGLPDHSVDVIFCIALVHHLEIPRVQQEMARILREGGFIVLKEPIRLSKLYDRVRKMLPSRTDVSEYEHPLTEEEFQELKCGRFLFSETRFFQLPFVNLFVRILPRVPGPIWRASDWIIRHVSFTKAYASIVVTRLRARPGNAATVGR